VIERVVEVRNPHGLHARPAALFVQKAASHEGVVLVAKGGKEVNAKSILSVMSLGIEPGETIRLQAEGEGAEALLDALQAIAQDQSI